MSDIVVDSSVVVKWVVPEPDSWQAQRVVADAGAAGGRLIVLDLVYPEVVNAIWKQHRQKLATLPKAREFLDDLKRLPVHVEPAARLLDEAFDIAVKYDRAVYDALFVALVQDLGGPRRHGRRTAVQHDPRGLSADRPATQLAMMAQRDYHVATTADSS